MTSCMRHYIIIPSSTLIFVLLMQQRVHTRKNSTRAVNNEMKISAWRHQKKTIRAALKIRIASNIEATHTREK
jgi:hypothetical protein